MGTKNIIIFAARFPQKKLLKKVTKRVLICAGIGLLLYGIFVLLTMASFANSFETAYSKRDLIDNFNKRKDQIFTLRNYFKSIAPKYKEVEIEFSNDKTLGRFSVSSIDSVTGNVKYPIFVRWRLEVSSSQVDSVIRSMNWSQQTLRTLKEKLDSAHCISIRSGEPCQIGFQRSGMGMYFYDLFTNPIPDAEKDRFNNGCRYIFYNPILVLEYGGGAIGPQCFPKD